MAIDSTNGGTISGTVILEGPCPAPQTFLCGDNVGCDRASVTAQHWIVNNGKVANAFIYIKDGLDNKKYTIPTSPALLDQRHCVYKPHVMGLILGQPLEVLNSDSTLHNVHLTSASVGESFNRIFPQGMAPMSSHFETPGIKTIKCDVHGWMNCYIGVVPHPFFAVSDSTGHFEIKGVPPGDYTLELWHESTTGSDNAVVETKKISVKAKETQRADFSITAR